MVRVNLIRMRQQIVKYRRQQMMLQPKENFSYLKITNLINAQDFKFNKIWVGMLPFTDTFSQVYDSVL